MGFLEERACRCGRLGKDLQRSKKSYKSEMFRRMGYAGSASHTSAGAAWGRGCGGCLVLKDRHGPVGMEESLPPPHTHHGPGLCTLDAGNTAKDAEAQGGQGRHKLSLSPPRPLAMTTCPRRAPAGHQPSSKRRAGSTHPWDVMRLASSGTPA